MKEKNLFSLVKSLNPQLAESNPKLMLLLQYYYAWLFDNVSKVLYSLEDEDLDDVFLEQSYQQFVNNIIPFQYFIDDDQKRKLTLYNKDVGGTKGQSNIYEFLFRIIDRYQIYWWLDTDQFQFIFNNFNYGVYEVFKDSQDISQRDLKFTYDLVFDFDVFLLFDLLYYVQPAGFNSRITFANIEGTKASFTMPVNNMHQFMMKHRLDANTLEKGDFRINSNKTINFISKLDLNRGDKLTYKVNITPNNMEL